MQTLSKNKISHIASLQQKKLRIEHQQFVVEGGKGVQEFLDAGLNLEILVVLNEENASDFKVGAEKIFQVETKDAKKISSLSTFPEVLAVFKIPEIKIDNSWKNKFSLVLDGVRDPGNMGTIIRTADWFGIQHVFCSSDSVDIYNSKVVQATMGSLARVKVYSVNMVELLNEAKKELNFSVLGAFMEGEDVRELKSVDKGFLIMGNESQGIRSEAISFITKKVSIKRGGTSAAESLNVSIATAVLCHSLTR